MSAVYLWNVLCASHTGEPYWQRAPVESASNPTGGVCSDGSIIQRALRGALAPNTATSNVVAAGDTLDYGELFANTGTGIKLGAGSAGAMLVSQGTSGPLQWVLGGGGGTVTLINTGTGLTGGPITTTGTISFASAPDKCILGTSTGAGAPTPIVMAVGDLITNTGSSLVLPGNTTTTKMFLSQTGTGTASGVPQWSAISASNITAGQALTTSSPSYPTLSVTGTSSSALLSAVNIQANWTGVLPATRGGTGMSSYFDDGLAFPCFYADSPTTLTLTSVPSPVDITTLRIVGGLPVKKSFAYFTTVNDINITITLTEPMGPLIFEPVTLTVGWTGTLAAQRGGTGNGLYAVGDLLYADTITPTLAKLNIGSNGQFLKVSGGVPTWQTGVNGTLSAINPSYATLTIGGTPAGSLLQDVSLQLGWTGTLATARGGTGFSSYATGDMLYSNTTTTLAKRNVGTNGYLLTVSGGLPIWATAGVGSVIGTANQILANGTSGSPQTGAVTLTLASNINITTSLGVGVAPSGVSGEISGTDCILNGTPTIKADVFSIQTAAGVRMMNISSTPTTDLYLGFNAGASVPTTGSNVCIGESACTSLTSGVGNVAIGYQSQYSNSTRSSCTSAGYQSLYSNNSADGCTAFGYKAGYSINTASANFTAIGYQAGRDCTGVNCTFAGYNAGAQLTSGSNNTCAGSHAGYGASPFTASDLTAIGYQAGYALTTGNQNTLFGSYAGVALTSGSNNTLFGYNSGASLTTGSGNVFIGYNAGSQETGSNKLYIANSNTTTPLMYGDFSTPSLTINGSFTATLTVTCASTFQMTSTNVTRTSSASSSTPSFAALSAPYIMAGEYVITSAEVVGASCTRVSFTSIPATFQHLKFIITMVGSSDVFLLVQWGANGAVDTGANYYYQSRYGKSSAMTVEEQTATTSGRVSAMSNGGQATCQVVFSNYCANTNAGSAVSRSFSAYGGCVRSSAGTGYCLQSVGGNTNTTAIGQIDFIPSASSIAIGTKFTLYGMF